MIKIYKYGELSYDEIFAREDEKFSVESTVAEIIANVRENGDKAIFEYCRKFDGANLSSLLVSEEEIDEVDEPEFEVDLSEDGVYVEDDAEKSIDEVLDEFEKATDDIEVPKKSKIPVEDKKSAQKKDLI